MTWFAVLLYLWAAGMAGALALLPSDTPGPRFTRFNVLILLLLAATATIFGRPFFDDAPAGSFRFLTHALAWILNADIAALALAAWLPGRRLPSVAFLLPVITGALFGTAVAFGHFEDLRPLPAALLTAHLLTGGALLGSVLVAMNLGHSYLQNAAMSFDHLTRLARLFLGSALAKAAVSIVLLAPRMPALWPELLDTLDGMLVLVRVVAGLGGPVALGWMVLSCAMARANQSATGILYAAVVFVLVGEGLSLHLTLGRNLPA